MQDHVPLCVKRETVCLSSKLAKVAKNALVQDYLRGDCHDVTMFCFIDIKISAKKYIIYMMRTSTHQLSPPLYVQSESFESEGVPDAPAALGETSVTLPAPDVVSAHYFSENSTKP